MKIFAIDIGNSNTKFAIVQDGKILNKVQLPSENYNQLTDALPEIYNKFTVGENLPIVICSVVETLMRKISNKAELALDITPLIIGKDIPFPLELDLKNTKNIGADRIVTAAMAYERIGQAVAIASFGTAITIDCVDDRGVFLGGTILPGLKLALKALAQYTSALPNIEPDFTYPVDCFGKNTQEAMNSGVILGAAGALREIVEQFATKLGKWPELIITGGDANIIRSHCDFAQAIVPDLLLMGIELTYEKWKSLQDEDN